MNGLDRDGDGTISFEEYDPGTEALTSLTNKTIKKLVENVQFHHSRKHDEIKFQSAWGDKFVLFRSFCSPSSFPAMARPLQLKGADRAGQGGLEI